MIERLRRAHLNDMENTFSFMIASSTFMLTQPSEFLAINLVRIGVISRFVYTLVYVFYPMQPQRTLSFFTSYGITLFMAVKVFFAFM